MQDDFKVTPALTLNLGLRWAYTQPVVEKDNRQGNFDLTTGQEILAADGSRESRALYKSYKKGFEPRLGFAWRPDERWVFRGGYGISQYMEGTGANLRLPLNPPFFFESAVQYDATTGAGTLATGLRRAACRSISRRDRCARGIRTCGRSSRSSGTCSPSTCSPRRCRPTSDTSATTRTTW